MNIFLSYFFFWTNATKLKDFLTKDNTINVIQTFDGKETIRKYIQFRPDLLVLDYKLPKLNGDKVLDMTVRYFNDTYNDY